MHWVLLQANQPLTSGILRNPNGNHNSKMVSTYYFAECPKPVVGEGKVYSQRRGKGLGYKD